MKDSSLNDIFNYSSSKYQGAPNTLIQHILTIALSQHLYPTMPLMSAYESGIIYIIP